MLTDPDLSVAAAEFVSIVGKRGCGKSTLLRLIAGLDTPTRGQISFGNASADAAGAIRIMFQEPRLLPWVSVIDNVAVGLPSAAD